MADLPSKLRARRLVVLAIHGIPSTDVNHPHRPRPYLDPRAQLEPINQFIKQAALYESVTWLDCPWILGKTTKEWPDTLPWDAMGDSTRTLLAARPAALLSKPADQPETFSNTYLGSELRDWFIKLVQECTSDNATDVVVIAYSAGGYLVYRWLSEQATPDIVQKIRIIFCIAAPFRFQQPSQKVALTLREDNYAPLKILVSQPSVDPPKLTQHLRHGQLVVLQAGKLSPTADTKGSTTGDKTVLVENSSFLENKFQAPEIIEYPLIEGTNHLTILTHPETMGHIQDHLRKLFGL